MPTRKKLWELVSFSALTMGSLHILFLLVPTLLTEHKHSQDGLDSTQPAFDELTKSCLLQKLPIEIWKSAEHLAMKNRGNQLRIFDISHEKAPTLAEVTLQLMETQDHSNNSMNVVNWIAHGIRTQNDQ